MSPARFSCCASVILFASSSALAADTWSTPGPGLQHLHRRTSNQSIDVLLIDLCTPGISLRATNDGERGRRVSSFGSLVGASAAINGDFFGGGFSTDGIAMSGGAQWSGADHTYVAPVAVGDGRVEIIPHWLETGAEPWMREVVSGHPTLLEDGTFIPSDDPLCTNRHPRTAIGITQDHRQLIWAVVDGRRTDRIGMNCGELTGLLQEFGAFDAVNMDGGGSSTMWTAAEGVVNSPSDGSERTVGNHFGVYASGSGAAPACPAHQPRGYLDSATCDGLSGWTWDPDDPERPLDVHVYIGGPAGTPGVSGFAIHADQHRNDLCTALGHCNHGFAAPFPDDLKDGRLRPVYTYAIGGSNPLLVGSPSDVRCFTAPPIDSTRGVIRHIPSPTVMSNWQFDFAEVAPLTDDVINSYSQGRDWDESPLLITVAGEPQVWLIDGAYRRHVPSPAAMNAWRLDWGAIQTVDASVRDTWIPASPLPVRPYLLKGSGFAIYMLDVHDPQSESSDAGVVLSQDDAGVSSTVDSGAQPMRDIDTSPTTNGSGSGCNNVAQPGSFIAITLLLFLRRRRT